MATEDKQLAWEDFEEWLERNVKHFDEISQKPIEHGQSKCYRQEARAMYRVFNLCLTEFKKLLPPPTTLN